MYKKFQSCSHVGVGGIPWLDSLYSHTHTQSMFIRESLRPRLHVKFLKKSMVEGLNKCVCVCGGGGGGEGVLCVF